MNFRNLLAKFGGFWLKWLNEFKVNQIILWFNFKDTPAIFQNTNSLSKQKLLAMGCIDSSFMYQVILFFIYIF